MVRDDRVRSPFRAVHRGDLRDALALVAAIAVVGASFGALAAAGGVPPLLIVGMSVLVFAGERSSWSSPWSRPGGASWRRWPRGSC